MSNVTTNVKRPKKKTPEFFTFDKGDIDASAVGILDLREFGRRKRRVKKPLSRTEDTPNLTLTLAPRKNEKQSPTPDMSVGNTVCNHTEHKTSHVELIKPLADNTCLPTNTKTWLWNSIIRDGITFVQTYASVVKNYAPKRT